MASGEIAEVVVVEGVAAVVALVEVVAEVVAKDVAVAVTGEEGGETLPVVSVASRRIRRVEGAMALAFHRNNMMMPCGMVKGVRSGSSG